MEGGRAAGGARALDSDLAEVSGTMPRSSVSLDASSAAASGVAFTSDAPATAAAAAAAPRFRVTTSGRDSRVGTETYYASACRRRAAPPWRRVRDVGLDRVGPGWTGLDRIGPGWTVGRWAGMEGGLQRPEVRLCEGGGKRAGKGR